MGTGSYSDSSYSAIEVFIQVMCVDLRRGGPSLPSLPLEVASTPLPPFFPPLRFPLQVGPPIAAMGSGGAL